MTPSPTFLEDSFITIKIRYRAASLALLATVGLTLLKLGTAFFSHSVGVLSEGVHSGLDLISAALTFFTVREAAKPADEDHPFGHGKIETLSSLFESLLLAIAAGIIIFEGVDHLRFPVRLDHSRWAMAVMVLSIIISYLLYRHNARAANETDSSALHVNSLHFLSDVMASLGILVGLIAMELTGWDVIDPIIAFVVAAYILIVSMRQVKGALLELSDTQLPAEEIRKIWSIVEGFKERTIEVHDLRTRKSGATRHIDFHLVVCRQMTVEESHRVCDELESQMIAQFPGSSVNIHVEPCEKGSSGCDHSCRYRLEGQNQTLGRTNS